MKSIELSTGRQNKTGLGVRLLKDFLRYKYLYIMVLPVIVYYILFSYIPMYGVVMAFQKFNLAKGVFGSPFIGFKNFIDFFTGPYCWRTIRNTIMLNFYGLIFVFPAPVIFALLINELWNKPFKRIVQTISYLPYFISVVVICGMIYSFCSQDGFITYIFKIVTGYSDSLNLLLKPEYFRSIFTISEIWQHTGFSSIIYISALSSINPELYEAATIDGAGRWKQMIHITLPGIAPTIIILFILRLGSIMNVGFDKVFLLYNPATYETADVIGTYVYRQGLTLGQYSYSTAVGLFNSIINFIMLVLANWLSKRATEVSLF